MATTQQKLMKATNKLARYYGLYTAKDLSGQIALETINRIPGSTDALNLNPPSDLVALAVATLIDSSEGANLTKTVVVNFNNALSNNTSQTIRDEMFKFVEIHGADSLKLGSGVLEVDNSLSKSVILNPLINSIPDAPTKEAPNLTVFKVNHIRATPTSKNINSSVIFLNGVPNLELAKAVPYLDVKLLFPGSPISVNGGLQNMSMFRFLEGNINLSDSDKRRKFALGTEERLNNNQSNPTEENSFTSTGMDIFLSPQTLVNGNEKYNESNRVNPILDKFQPLMTLKNFEITIAPSTGIMSFKTGKLTFTLHDRSRLAEIADMIRPDLYSRSELLIEYGWSHPEASNTNSITNHYAELINAMRVKEKYGIINSSITIGDSGQAEISLDLAMRGSMTVNTEFVSTDEDGSISRILDTIRDLEQAIGNYRERIYGQQEGGSNREVRGIQILDVAADARSNILLDRNARTQLNQFIATLRNVRNTTPGGNVPELIASLNNLYGSSNGNNSDNNNDSAITRLRRSVQDQIRAKLVRLASGDDLFLKSPSVPGEGSASHRVSSLTQVVNDANTQQRRQNVQTRTASSQLDIELPQGANTVVSLGKLLTLFIGEPMANTNRYNEIQLLFYPFNQYAGLANNINIASFAVNIRYFFEQYSRYRLENASRSANLTLRDFLTFISTTILDDVAAPSYGLFQAGLMRYQRNDQGLLQSQAVGDAAQLQVGMENLLRSITPDGSFRMPQIDFYIETIPERISSEDNSDNVGSNSIASVNEKTITRIHIFDRQNTCYDSQASLLSATRENEIRTIAQIPLRSGGDGGVSLSQEQEASNIIQAATNANLIVPNDVRQNEAQTFRINGGSKKLKEFITRTTPYIIFGVQGTTIKSATVTSIQDSGLSTVNMLRSFQATNMEPNGELPGGLPLQIIPTEVNIGCLGNPLIDFAQQFFIDFQTGTSIDNLYAVTGMSHRISQGEFFTDLKMTPLDAWGKYRSLVERVNAASVELQNIENQRNQTTSTNNGTAPRLN